MGDLKDCIEIFNKRGYKELRSQFRPYGQYLKYVKTSDLKIEEGRLQVVVGEGDIGFIVVLKRKNDDIVMMYERHYAPVLWNDILGNIHQEIPHNFKGSIPVDKYFRVDITKKEG